MRKLKLAVSLLAIAGALVAEQSRVEKANPAKNPSDDSKPNSDKVPDVYAIPGQFQKVLVLRFKYDADLLAGIEQMVKENKIKNAVILSGAGSVRGYHVHQVSNRTLPSKNMFVKDPSQPADIISMNGYIINGQIHAHMTMADPDKAFGGHLEPGTKVFTFGIVTLGIMDDATDFTHLDDKTYR